MPTPKAAAGARRLPRCTRCERAIRVPKGWSSGAAVRRHYWAKHRGVMLRDRSSGRRTRR